MKVGRGVGEDGPEPVGWPSDASVGAMLDQSGVIRVDTLTQMFHTGTSSPASRCPPARASPC